MNFLPQKRLSLIGAVLGLAYGLFARFVFGFHVFQDFFEVMSVSFIFGVPFCIGFISVWSGPYLVSGRGSDLVLVPCLSMLACLLAVLALVWEGIICVILWLPVSLVLAIVGGLFAALLLKLIKPRRDRFFCIALVALLPFGIAPLEKFRANSSEIDSVPTQIKIHATPEVVWQQIRSVSLITNPEQSFSFSHLFGFPRPLEAKLVGEGLGAVRYATFERGVLFEETITEWEQPKKISFSIRADSAHIPPTTFDEHVIIGGKYFDVLNGSYSIEDIGNGDVILHLSSDQRLSTGFNFYSRYWTEYLMADLQNYILRIIKARCENQGVEKR